VPATRAQVTLSFVWLAFAVKLVTLSLDWLAFAVKLVTLSFDWLASAVKLARATEQVLPRMPANQMRALPVHG